MILKYLVDSYIALLIILLLLTCWNSNRSAERGNRSDGMQIQRKQVKISEIQQDYSTPMCDINSVVKIQDIFYPLQMLLVNRHWLLSIKSLLITTEMKLHFSDNKKSCGQSYKSFLAFSRRWCSTYDL